MQLSSQQIEAIKGGEAVRLVPPEIGRECVVVRSDIYQRIGQFIEDLDPSRAYMAIDEAWREGWDTPQMAEYDRYEEHRK